MAIESHPRCDVYRDKWGESVREFELELKPKGVANETQRWTPCLSPEAKERLVGFIAKGCKPPTRRTPAT